MTPQEMVTEFHATYGLDVGREWDVDWDSMDVSESEKLVRFRDKLITEEFHEVINAEEPEEILKELADLVYVCYGYAVTFGWDLDEALRRVHQSNMSKLGEDGKPIYREDGKVLKGPNYKEADLSDLV